MTDDLVKRLRERAEFALAEMTGTGKGDARHFSEAADRIEKLERLYIGALHDGERVYGDLVEANGNLVDCRNRIEALERERDVANAAVVLQEGLLQTLRGLVRNEALEEAARVAEEVEHAWANELEEAHRGYGEPATPSPSTAIRALMEKE